MTTYIPFQPQANSSPPFQATITLDNTTYNLVCLWNLYTGWWNFFIYDQSQTQVYSRYLAGSPPGADIYLTPLGMFTSTILYRDGTGNFEINP